MERKSLTTLLILSALSLCSGDVLKDSLDSMQKMLSGEDKFPSKYYSDIVTCLNKLDGKLLESVNAQFEGFKTFAAAGGDRPDDPWYGCNEGTRWFEGNCTVQEYGQIPIWEPCNYASNVAYFRTVLEICDREQTEWSFPQEAVNDIGKTFASLVLGSGFMHASHTSVGGLADTKLNDLLAYVVYQEAVSQLETDNPSVLYELSRTPRASSARDVVNDLMNVYIEAPVEEWGHILSDVDIPDVDAGMCGFISGVLTLIFEDEVVDQIVETLLEKFQLFPEDLAEFCLNDFLTEFRKATEHMRPLPEEDREQLLGNTISTIAKLIYALVWQEEQLVTSEIIFKPGVNEIGANLLPLINTLATGYGTFEYSYPLFLAGSNFYPGEEWCNSWDPHAKWHLETAIGLVDFTFLGDHMHRLIANAKNRAADNAQ